ncbi:UDP-N-acetylmuramoyl-tripeptide--D-alanyl-D-alanine ligase [Cellulomonas fimi]|uniref:UDP-N-acetylmuramoyl-tripeptide--D-alanyl-D-alanine ligase n=1 Tax=Cellulomonas fimi (strain ATCC 484 / DSM 20113 / JCM 1341 / CCUG 24087 / LMG 16345 / NBRC 15513 / NCIMB 8980 / NCTC 7547 / NRS-133) TaxID=590998 RepID=F4H7R0_CELFA|nr:UDP-N-acetylmuramoyl-tripeptide--D-alanyl-D-alanine ligase [Cellulomonas fimi]AEE45744.1 UDP-N-acetylmuramoylalanyl-D-glutamyl-2,6-diaminopimelate/D-alanyl-D-alanyl ligase [Cellulomonas fimi ATCC 484]NNH09067.1 UDP-N-acetylmuramoyl-tripeptide--D-alanyl-D-alanine ligase [Cellulomonas fimi]VEH30470.1 UDP-N-acetylmuramoyl-tripeptide--D-alanyl-D-alanine ligase [Cellulomonas fimi]
MIALTAAEIAAATGGVLRAEPDVDPHGLVVAGAVVTDSREVEPGGLFVALPGEHVDGHDYAPGAVAAGAALVLGARELTGADGRLLPVVVVPDVERALGDLAREVLVRLRAASLEPGGPGLRVVGITGSVGKTTTKDLLAQLCGSAGPTVAPVRSFNNEIGLPLTVLRADESTRFLVLEMGASGPGHLTYLTDIAPPDVAVVLVVGHAHLGGFGGIEAVATAKSEIVQGLLPDGVAVLNADDPRVLAMRALAPGDVVTFGASTGAQVRAHDVVVDRSGRARFVLEARDGAGSRTVPVELRLVGEHHVHNALAAAATGLAVGLTLDEVAVGLGAADALSPHRMHVVERPDGVTVIDDSYNANPDSMRAALKALAVLAGRDRRSVAVLGEMLELGDEAREAHDAIGRLVVRLNVGLTVVVGEGARAIRDGANHEGSWGDEVVLADDLETAARFLDEELRPGDVVLVKSSYGAGLWQLGDLLVGEVAQ